MADYRLGGNVDFSWLGNLPDVYRESKDRQTRKSTLSDLKSGDADSLLAAGSRLIAAGDLEGGLKLIAEGRQRKAVDVRADELSIYRNMPGLNLPGLNQSAPSEPVTFPGGNAPPPQAAPPARDMFQGPPGAIPGVTQAPPQAGPQQAAGPSPSEAMILAAQQPPPTPPGTQQLAGPPPTPNTLPGQTPVMSAETLNAAAAPAVQAPPQAELGVRLEPPSAQGIRPNQTPPEVTRNIGAIANEMAKTPPKATGRMNALRELMKVEIEKTNWKEDTKKFMIDQADRRAAGEPVQSRSEWDAENKTLETTYKSAIKKYETYSEDGQKGQALNNVLGAMEGIINHPQFASGVGTPIFAQGVSGFTALLDTAKIVGVPKHILDKFGDPSKFTTPAALQEAFTALSNQAIYAKLGSLGNQISEGDRNFIKLAFPSLSLTKEGNMFLIGIMKKMAENAEKAGTAAQGYFEQAGPRANPAVMDRIVRQAAKENSLFVKDGQVTDAGEAVKAAVKAAREGRLQAPEQAAPAAAPASAPLTSGRGRPLNGPKTRENPEGLYIRLPNGQIVPENQT